VGPATGGAQSQIVRSTLDAGGWTVSVTAEQAVDLDLTIN
jgi:hypothetical protein